MTPSVPQAHSTASSVQGKAAALAALSRLSQQMMRQAVWKELEKDVLVQVIQRVFRSIGVRLTHRRLAQVVPVVGGVVSAGMSYDMLDRALRDATWIYRVRYLAEKHGLSFDEWVDKATANDAADLSEAAAVDEEPIDVEAEMQAVIREQGHTWRSELLRSEDPLTD